mmetsp:Transcript_11235/g.22241  ORF Transcript_11235/g.22241 Transcript_11235/m.22241 type:complete len:255 (+) Transcript_11235:43-807(+)|eukprot:CAMPEP_0173390404 /NCGR_PEP_ID=MMETSP1356-20130122/14743_1 /TAXON_ID=77927 ORGANISM="Hemiselmis virescens, Strain PCC157" /NCGR_SAMPLE_ID=MMETSP1356 /ASSEMBLY_ACC=CAM_ASM_000847 /LENGTH=254 /DNA_ID=CAMNT_0014347781 /DNA_START=24 /DNA_END=788 /DNA_ORIENTATION=-
MSGFLEPLQEKRMQKHCVAECLGTFLYIYMSEACAVNSDTQGMVTNALGNGFTLAVLIYCFSGENGSGAKLNPAVSTGLRLTGRLDNTTYLWEIISQTVGAILGAICLRITIPGVDVTHTFVAMGGVSSGHPLSTFIWEFLMTGFVVYVVFATQVDKQTRHGSDLKITLPAPFAPLAVGLAVACGAFASVPYTGGAMNPLRALAPALVFWNWKNIWVYVLATMLGGTAGAVVYENVFLEHQPPEDEGEANEASV